jgi:pyruvate dehydrogenase (quinone)/pyruvate oxidase
LLKRNADRGFLRQTQTKMHTWRQEVAEQGARQDKPMRPQLVAWELGKRLAPDAVVAADSGTVTTWWARYIPVQRGQLHSVSGNLASMANALPYAMAAQLAYPDRQCVAFMGDGGFAMLMADFVTCVKYHLPVKVIILKNNTLGQIKWEQTAMLGHPEYGCELQPIDFAAFARACGATGLTIEDPAACGAILDTALTTSGPVVVEAIVDADELTTPPKPT